MPQIKEKKAFMLLINGKLIQYLKPNETKFLTWEQGKEITIIPVKMSESIYKIIFGQD